VLGRRDADVQTVDAGIQDRLDPTDRRRPTALRQGLGTVALRVGHGPDADPGQPQQLLDVSARHEAGTQHTHPHLLRTGPEGTPLMVLGHVRAGAR
jgi:hypothetical protein